MAIEGELQSGDDQITRALDTTRTLESLTPDSINSAIVPVIAMAFSRGWIGPDQNSQSYICGTGQHFGELSPTAAKYITQQLSNGDDITIHVPADFWNKILESKEDYVRSELEKFKGNGIKVEETQNEVALTLNFKQNLDVANLLVSLAINAESLELGRINEKDHVINVLDETLHPQVSVNKPSMQGLPNKSAPGIDQ